MISKGFDGHVGPTRIYKLNCALYGLTPPFRILYEKINSWLLSQGLKLNEASSNLFYLVEQGKYTIVVISVHDMLITSDNIVIITNIQEALIRDFEMTHLGEEKHYLEAELEYHPSCIWVHQ